MNWDPAHLPDQTGRTIVVTGATAGIGYFAAEQLAATGAEVVLASRSEPKLQVAKTAILQQVPGAAVRTVVIDLASFDSVARAADELQDLPRIDGILLNGGAMSSGRGTTADGIPLLLGTHVVANVRLIAGVLPALVANGESNGSASRIVHTSTGFVEQFRMGVDDVGAAPRVAIAAYTKAKTVTEVFAFELDRRLRAAGLPVASLVVRPGVGVDARTPERVGIRDRSTPYQRNPYTPWAQGKDTAAWSAVRALTDPAAQGGDYYSPTGRLRGLPVKIAPLARTSTPPADLAESVWGQLEKIAGVRIPLGVASGF
ncbi:SDR family NAD(P)-dependent oxidoreductase [Microbacterium sp. W4I20]|uniref:SDR family NAD(P)-dependent oxidoreductase n=1 Tax=Microbacterium sp. W4I20 TaxID=3042262 RepID=UPI002786A8A3|nr:SDR family NAD(P)-dependent oxidoreductase [Microbacterium sp. W4I20]MDQ0727861.1 NAD(P)-dependent dehydrogenase (short-subunit alcohol dehydrogenase family) [Microbacterium sp. W4I20]